MSHPIDEKFQRALEFAKRFNTKHDTAAISNLYVMQTVDRDGNITGEYYGRNVMTDYAMTQYFTNAGSWPTNLYIGNGAGTFDHTTNELLSPIVTSAATVTSSTRAYNYPLYYDAIGGNITCVCKYLECYFDYNVSGIEGPVDISEYGIGTSVTALWTHSWVYNSLGDKSTIRKNLNERLLITVYFCMTYNESLITTAWSNQRYIVITNMERFFHRSTVSMDSTSCWTYRRDSSTQRTLSTQTLSAVENNVVSIYSTMGEFLIDTTNANANVYIDGFISWSGIGMSMIDRVYNATAIPFDTTTKPQNDYFISDKCFSYNFGYYGYGLKFSFADITNSYTLNFRTGLYECADSFDTYADKWYSNDQSFELSWKHRLYFTNNNAIEELYVYRNMTPDDPIIKVSGPATIYATDQYWNTSSFQLITDKNNIPVSLQSKKYWLTPSSDTKITVERGNKGLWYTSSQTLPTVGYTPRLGFYHTLSNPGYWYMIGNTIYSMDKTQIIRVGNDVDNDYTTTDSWEDTQSYGYENIIVSIVKSSADFYVTNLNNTTPVPTKVTNAANIADLGHCHKSETKTGFLVIAESHTGSSTHSVIKIDMRNGSCTNTQLADARDASAIALTNNYAYIDQTDQRCVYVKSLIDNTLVQTFNIPSNKNVAKFVFGYRDLVYVSDCSSYTYVCNVTTGTMTLTNGALHSKFANADYVEEVRMCVMNECALIYLNYRAYSTGGAYLVKYDDPATLVVITPLDVTSYDPYFERYEINLLKINTNTIIMTVMARYNRSGYTNAVVFLAYDFGHFMYDGTKDNLQVMMNNYSPWVPYGDYYLIGQTVIPNANFVTHRLVGTTDCVCTLATFKNIRGKQWELKVSNLGGYSGLPPGNIQ